MITIEKALSTILASISPLPLQRMDITRCGNLVLAEDIDAPENIPPFTNSAMDGYAVRSKDTIRASKNSPAVLTILEDLPAGRVTDRQIGEKEAIRIMTGAPLPRGADAVVKVEDTSESHRVKNTAQSIEIYKETEKGENIREAGESVKKGEKMLSKGKVLRPQEIGMLAALGYSAVRVIPHPRVAIISTGDELQEIEAQPLPGKIRDCNRYSLIALVEQVGGIPVPLGIVPDREEDIGAAFLQAISQDAIITSGGVSVGKYDLVKKILGDLGDKASVWQVAMKPGKPLSFGLIQGKPFFGLPGNPVSVVISFWQFVRPALLKMQGKTKLRKQIVEAVLIEDCAEMTARTHLVRAILTKKDGAYFARPTGPQGSGILSSLVLGNALLVIPPNRGPLKKGEKVAVMLVEEPEID